MKREIALAAELEDLAPAVERQHAVHEGELALVAQALEHGVLGDLSGRSFIDTTAALHWRPGALHRRNPAPSIPN